MIFLLKRTGLLFALPLLISLGCERSPKGAPAPQKDLKIDLVWSSSGEEQAFARFGSALATGDVNGDGLPDLLVAAEAYNTGRAEAGKVYLYLGTPTGLSEKPAWNAVGSDEGAYFGSSVALADLNHDGYADAIIGASNQPTANGVNVGKVAIYFGGPNGLAAAPGWTSSGENQAGAFYGISVASAGDVNGDGFDDLLVGASGFNDRGMSVGKAYLYLGGPKGPAAAPAWSAMGDHLKGAGFGFTVGAAGDANHDGYGDLLVAAPRMVGKVFLYEGSADGPRPWPAWTASGDRQGGSAFGLTLAAVGDVNGDRFSDLAVGAPLEDTPGRTDAGRAFLFFGSPWGLSRSPGWKAAGDDQIDAQFGTAVIPIGDVNHDGYDDLLIGAKEMRTDRVHAGRVYLYLGGPAGLSPRPVWASSGEDRENAFFGLSGAPFSFRDFSGFVVGASGDEKIGKVYLYRVQTAPLP